MNKWFALIAALRLGASLADPATWKERQVLINVCVGLIAALYAIARAFGWVLWEVDSALLQDLGVAIGTAVFTVANVVLTVATTDKVGLLPSAPPATELREPPRPAPLEPVQPDAGGGHRDDAKRTPNPFLDDQ